ncbi:MAG: DUF72 domain-containing protein [Candidatus Bipolaricaulota bacterium]|nr:DUF72 domain-containing protein [Candidatus Bipolaricaulota bacterium]
MPLRIGCCGWSNLRPEEVGERNWREKYSHRLQLYAAHFPLVEVNSTFYRHPRPGTAERWRALADAVNPEFEFTVKVHREVTHADRFRGARSRDAYARSLGVARALRARILLFQSPGSFGPTAENEEALRRFVGDVDREGVLLAWEPRGEWLGQPERIRLLCEELGLLHVTDPFVSLPVPSDPLVYLRLHGSPPGDRMYAYAYTDEDLAWLRGQLVPLQGEVYVLFNNLSMVPDALRFRALGEGR